MAHGISLSDFSFLNPEIDANCTNLYLNYSYCLSNSHLSYTSLALPALTRIQQASSRLGTLRHTRGKDYYYNRSLADDDKSLVGGNSRGMGRLAHCHQSHFMDSNRYFYNRPSGQ
jgi:hypothetical protein